MALQKTLLANRGLDAPSSRDSLIQRIPTLLKSVLSSPVHTIDNDHYDNLLSVLKDLHTHHDLQFPKLRKELSRLVFHDRYAICGTTAAVTVRCKHCDVVKETAPTVLNCQSRYCDQCSEVRYKKAYSRLMDYELPDRLNHSVIGFPKKQQYTRSDRQECQFAIQELIRELKKEKINFRGLKVLDLADGNDQYLHFHLATRLLSLNYAKIQAIASKVSSRIGIEFVWHNIGERPKARLFQYFAKRTAGLYGHGDHHVDYTLNSGRSVKLSYGYMLKDIMSLDEYYDEYHSQKALSSIGSIRRAVLGKKEAIWCPECLFKTANLIEIYIPIFKFRNPEQKSILQEKLT